LITSDREEKKEKEERGFNSLRFSSDISRKGKSGSPGRRGGWIYILSEREEGGKKKMS